MKEYQHNAKAILRRYINGQCTEEERIWVEEWFKKNYNAEFKIDQVLAEEHLADVWQELQRDIGKKTVWSFQKITTIAASIILVLGIGAFYLWQSQTREMPQVAIQQKEHQIQTGRNQALLTLADGQKIHLDSIVIGEHITKNNITITKLDDGTLAYKTDTSTPSIQVNALHTISTPRGGQYKVVLPDNSIVWLNAASSLRFPAVFSDNTRSVELIGEGYFEVAHDIHKPFIVTSQDQQTIVKGTKFNITTYPGDSEKTTTLLEGSVLVKNTVHTDAEDVLLLPNEQAVLHQNVIIKSKVDATEAIAWKNGKFKFNNTPIQTIMQQLSRWYNVEVVYLSSIEEITFTGSISRFDDIQDVLRKISLTESVQFETKGGRVMVRH